MEYIDIDIPVRAWGIVDGCADNTVAVDVVDGAIEAVAIGACVRDAGWRAFAQYPGQLNEIGWPPQEHVLRIVLRRAHWEWVLAQLDRWEPLETDVSYAEVRALIAAGLDAE